MSANGAFGFGSHLEGKVPFREPPSMLALLLLSQLGKPELVSVRRLVSNADAVGNSQTRGYARRDVQRGLREKPEGSDREHNTQDEPVGTLVAPPGRSDGQCRVSHLST